MLLRRVMEHVRDQNWAAVAIDFVIVVVGVFIGIQVANWNDLRKGYEQEALYYCKIREDLLADVGNIDKSISSLQERASAGRRLLKNLLGLEVERSVIIEDYVPAIRSLRYIPTQAALTDITSSGKLELLRRETLKSAILDHYTQQDAALRIIRGNAERMIDAFFDTPSFTDFGLQHTSQFEQSYDDELRELMPGTDWHRQPESPLYRHIRELMNISVLNSARETALLRGIRESAQRLSERLQPLC